jgi:hypothetical protein
VATFVPAMSHKLYMCPRRIAFELLLDRSRKNLPLQFTSTSKVALANADVIRPKKTIARSNLATVSDFSR